MSLATSPTILEHILTHARREISEGLHLLTVDIEGCWTLTKGHGPPLLQVLPNEEKILVYDPLFHDTAINIQECFAGKDIYYTIQHYGF